MPPTDMKSIIADRSECKSPCPMNVARRVAGAPEARAGTVEGAMAERTWAPAGILRHLSNIRHARHVGLRLRRGVLAQPRLGNARRTTRVARQVRSDRRARGR